MPKSALEHGPLLIALDVGNSRVKWGRFDGGRFVDSASLPLDLAAYDSLAQQWGLPEPGASHQEVPVAWSLASVNPDGSEPLLGWLARRGERDVQALDDPGQLPLRIALEEPAAVGIDRLLDAVAVNELRPAGRPALIVDAGSAITVDAVSADGAFIGGAIAVGLGMGARALHEFTYWLPLLQVENAPPAVGKSTSEAIRSGLFWGMVGSINELICRQAATLEPEPCVYVTGGDAALLAPYLNRVTELVPELTLRGVYLSWQHLRSAQAR